MPNKGRATLQLGRVTDLQKRLTEGRLTHNDEKARARALRIHELREQGMTIKAIAEEMGETRDTVQMATRSSAYAVFVNAARVERARESVDVQAAREVAEQINKERLDAMAPRALDYMESCFEQDADGNWVDKGSAAWASEKIIKFKGWEEANRNTRPVIEINIGTIEANSNAIRASDAARVIDAVAETVRDAADAALPAPQPATP